MVFASRPRSRTPPRATRARSAQAECDEWARLERRQKRAGLGRSPRTILGELGRIQSSDIVLQLADGSGRELRIRCVVRSDKGQALLLERLGLELPERLRIPSRIARIM